MELTTATTALGALAHETRLEVFRVLVRAGHDGLPVGRIADELGVAADGRLSFHLKELVAAGLAGARQEGRFVFYTARYEAMNALLQFLTEDCCGGVPCAASVDSCVPATTTATTTATGRKTA